MFQSSPAPRCGRYSPSGIYSHAERRFNPRPHRDAGATGGHPQAGRIPARFNPRPHRDAGATTFVGICRTERELVSILARTEMRALLGRNRSDACRARFQSSPAPRCGRYQTTASGAPLTVGFQSSPAPRCGRYLALTTAERAALVFQSSPAPRCGRYNLKTKQY